MTQTHFTVLDIESDEKNETVDSVTEEEQKVLKFCMTSAPKLLFIFLNYPGSKPVA